MFLIPIQISLCQNPIETWNLNIPFDSSRTKSLYFKVESFNFFDNAEYASPHITGATFIGTKDRLYLDYYLSPSLRIQTGVNVLKFSGRKEFSNIAEYFSLFYQPNSFITFSIGDIDFSKIPSLDDAIYYRQNLSYESNTKGMFVQFLTKFSNSAIFLNWRKFILPGDPYQEEFWAGFFNTFSWSVSDQLSVDFPINLSGYHRGGEIDNTALGKESIVNSKNGIELTWKQANHKFTLGSFLLTFWETTDNSRYPFSKGYGINSQINYGWKPFSLSVGYWHSYRYFSPLGHPLFNSYTFDKPNHIYNYQDFINFELGTKWGIDNIGYLLFDGEFRYDSRRNRLNFFTGIKLIISEEFFLTKVKKKILNENQ